jgi:peptidoglycan/xylan/chitin deacetylase (PgdA/CDA1 family)
VLDGREAGAKESSFFVLNLGILKNDFDRQLQYLKRRYRVISLREYIQKRQSNANLRGYAVITFDDGIKDISIDSLEEKGLTATFLIFARSWEDINWRHRLYLIIDAAKKSRFSIKIGEREESLSLTGPENKRNAIYKIRGYLQGLMAYDRDSFLNKLQLELVSQIKNYPYLSHEDIVEALSKGIDFASHSFSHCDLTSLDEADLRMNLKSSYDWISGLTQRDDVAFSLPYGKSNKMVVECVKQAGFSCCLTSEDGLCGPGDDLYGLKRVYMNVNSLPEFVFKVSGAEMVLQKLKGLCHGRGL